MIQKFLQSAKINYWEEVKYMTDDDKKIEATEEKPAAEEVKTEEAAK